MMSFGNFGTGKFFMNHKRYIVNPALGDIVF